jgi:uncharacterized protein (DUF924 family)
MRSANDVLEFWFGSGPLDEARLAERSRFWFGGDGAEARAARDAEIREKLGPLLEQAARGEFASWSASPRRRLALIILFDQVPRNIHRGSAQAFAFDDRALALSVEGLQLAADQALQPWERLFFYLPLEHAESIEAQDAAVAAFTRLAAEAPAEYRDFCTGLIAYAHKHRDLIRLFGRFPHRNEVLGRPDTHEERVWLADHPSYFG